ncbi:hypothetical protein FRC11_008405 [Ceratobasidium sp. 423]|nr:hypothetical protein FRC11_008405 [Ceratobasidium sp. 423]
MVHWVWDYFASDGMKSNSSNKNVWCQYKLTPIIKGLAEEDQLSILQGEIDAPQTEKLLILEAVQSITPEQVLRSKIDVMLQHLHDKCTYVSPELKQKATKELMMRKCSESAQSTSTNTQTSSISSAAPPTPTAQSAHRIDVGQAPIVLLTPAKPATKAQIVVKWFNNHSHTLGLLRQEQHHMLRKILALILAVATCWSSFYQSLCQREALLLAGGKTPKAKEAVKEVLDILNNDQFWMDTAQ